MRTWILALCAIPAIAVAEPAFVAEHAVIVGRVGDGPWSDAATEARADQTAELAAIVIGKRGGKRVVLAPDGVASARIAGTTYKTEALVGAKLQWSTVEPHGFRAKPATNGVTSDFYSNVSVEPRTFGKWVGYDSIDYFEHVLLPWSAAATIPAKVVASEPGVQQLPGLGTIRYKVEIELGTGAHLATPGADAIETAGIKPSVHRVSIRRGDDFLGRLSGYLLVPEVFGSAGSGRDHQTDRFTGADCADVMVGAARRMGRMLEYTNVAGLPSYARVVSGPVELDEHGTPAKPIRGVKPGDLIRIDYGVGSPRAGWDHVAALWEDRSDPAGPNKGGPDGQLDGFDLVIHMGHPRLKIEPLAAQTPATVDVLRVRQK
jgi:hypothetical protein